MPVLVTGGEWLLSPIWGRLWVGPQAIEICNLMVVVALVAAKQLPIATEYHAACVVSARPFGIIHLGDSWIGVLPVFLEFLLLLNCLLGAT